MKKILLATTVLAFSAGFAAAEVKFSGTAAMGVARDGSAPAALDDASVAASDAWSDYSFALSVTSSANTALAAAILAAEVDGVITVGEDAIIANAAEVLAEAVVAEAAALSAAQAADAAYDATDAAGFASYAGANLAVEFVGESDNGLTFGATFSVDVGRAYAFADDDGFSDGSSAFGNPEVYISGTFGKLAMSHNGYGFFHNDTSDDDQGDVKYTGTFGAFSVGLIADVEAYSPYWNDSDMSVNLAYAANNLAANLNYDDNGDYDVSLGYTMGAITATVANDHTNLSSLELAYNANGITGSVKFDTNSDWSASAGYSANSMTVNLSTNNASEWSIDGSYDLGGGLAIVAGVNYSDDAFLGTTMSF